MTSCRAPALLPVEQLTYDGGGAGDGNLTQKVDLTGAGTGRVTQTAFDWRDRENATQSGLMLGAGGAVVKDVTTYSPITYYVLDNLGEPTKTIQYDGANLSATSSTLGDS